MALRLNCLPAAIALGLMLSPPASAEDPAAVPAHDAALATDAARTHPVDGAAALPSPDHWSTRVQVIQAAPAGLPGHRDVDLKLRLVSRGDTGKVVTLKLVQLAAAAKAGGGRVDGFSKKNLRGTVIESVSSPAVDEIPALLRRHLAEYFTAHPDALPEHAQIVSANAGLWSLTYQSLSGNAVPYDLQHEATLTIAQSSPISPPWLSITCSDPVQTAPLEDWQADDYAQVRTAARQFAQRCVDRLVEQLPTVFPSPSVQLAAAISAASLDPVATGAAPQDGAATATDAGHPAPVLSTDWMKAVHIDHGTGTDAKGKRSGDADLRLVTRSDMGVATLAKMNIFALAVVGARKARGFSKDTLRGDTVEGVSSPAVERVPALLQQRLSEYFNAYPDAVPSAPVTVRADPHEWALVYGQLSGSQIPYELKHSTTIEVLPASGASAMTVDCTDGTQSAALPQWQADDYAEVRSVADELAEQCVARFVARLPEAFPSAMRAAAPASPVAAALPAGNRSRIRIFGANGRSITMHIGGQCRGDARRKVVVARSNSAAVGSLVGGSPQNISIGMPETDTVRAMKSVLFSNPNFQEYSVEAGKPLIFDAQFQNVAHLRCGAAPDSLSIQFVPKAGQDYEVMMRLENEMCVLESKQVAADGSLRVNLVHAPKACAAQ